MLPCGSSAMPLGRRSDAPCTKTETSPGPMGSYGKQIVFVRYEGEWIVVLQLVRAQVEPQRGEVYAYQYVPYPRKVAAQMSNEQAIVYVNTILRLISAAQRS